MADKVKSKGWPIAERGADMEMTEKNRKGVENVARWNREYQQSKVDKDNNRS